MAATTAANAPPRQASVRRASSSAVVRPTTVVLGVSNVVFRCVWACVLVVRCVSMLYLLVSAALYLVLAQPTMVYYASLLGSHAVPQLLPMAVVLTALAVAHAYRIVCMVFWSCVYGELVFEATSSNNKTQSATVHPLEGPRTSSRELNAQRLSCLGRVGQVWSSIWGALGGAYVWRLLFGSQGFFSIKSEYFEMRLALREFAEILSQTLQLYKASKLLAKHWITNLYAAIVVVNCWSTPVVQFRCRQKAQLVQNDLKSSMDLSHSAINAFDLPRLSSSSFEHKLQGVLALERLLCVAIDVVLDLTTSIVIPTVILHPYIQHFALSTLSFGSEILYDDVRFVSLVHEMQQVLATNPIEAVLAIFPHWGIYAGCGNVKSLLMKANHPSLAGDGSIGGSIVSVNAWLASPSPASAVESKDPRRRLHKPSGIFLQRILPWLRTVRSTIVEQFRRVLESNRLHGVFFLWGLAVFSLHLSSIVVAQNHASSLPAGCKQVFRPWLADKTSCSVFEFNCYMNQSTTVTESDFDALESEFLAVLVLSHCSALVVPSSIRNFPNLLGFEIFNSTIVQWSQRASLSAETQTRLAYVLLIRTNMTSFPEGLTTRLPANLLDIEISHSNLSALPENLDKHWHPMVVLYVEFTGLSSFPNVLSRLQVADLSLVGNQITTMSEGHDWSHVTSWSLSLARNPLEHLPATPIGNDDTLRFLELEHTAVRELPAWVVEATQARRLAVYLKDSPFCDPLPNEDDHSRFEVGAFVTCVDESVRGEGAVPVELIASHRPLVRELPDGDASS